MFTKIFIPMLSCGSGDFRSHWISRPPKPEYSVSSIRRVCSLTPTIWSYENWWKLVQVNVHLFCQLYPLDLILWNFTCVKRSIHKNAYQNVIFAKCQQCCSDLNEIKWKSHLLRANELSSMTVVVGRGLCIVIFNDKLFSVRGCL